MAGRLFSCCFRRRRSENLANQTLVTCHQAFAHGIEEIYVAQQSVQTTYDAVKAGISANQVKLQLTEEFLEKLSDELSSLTNIEEKMKEQIEMDEKYVEERKKTVSEISGNILQFRLSLDHIKDQSGFNEWVARNKDSKPLTKEQSKEKGPIEKELDIVMGQINGLYEDHDEKVAGIESLQVIRKNYMDEHNKDIDDFKEKLDMALQKRKLLEDLKTPQEIMLIFSSNVSELETTRKELVKFRALRELREQEIQSLRVELDELNKFNTELMNKVIHKREELVQLKAEKGNSKNTENKLPQGAVKLYNRIKNFFLNKWKR